MIAYLRAHECQRIHPPSKQRRPGHSTLRHEQLFATDAGGLVETGINKNVPWRNKRTFWLTPAVPRTTGSAAKKSLPTVTKASIAVDLAHPVIC